MLHSAWSVLNILQKYVFFAVPETVWHCIEWVGNYTLPSFCTLHLTCVKFVGIFKLITL
jgi:hypothetical protein